MSSTGGGGGWSSSLSSLDFFPKFVDKVQVRTFSGGAVSICAVILIIVLMTSEILLYLSPEVLDRLEIDDTRGNLMSINFEMTFPHVPCPILEIEAADVANSDMRSIDHYIEKAAFRPKSGRPDFSEAVKYHLGAGTRYSNAGSPQDYCGSCYGARPVTECCNTCEDVLAAYKQKKWFIQKKDIFEQCLRNPDATVRTFFTGRIKDGEGCYVHGRLRVPKVAGNFKFTINPMFKNEDNPLIKDLIQTYPMHRWQNISHVIKSIRFGEEYQGIVDPLKGAVKSTGPEAESASFLYYLKVVPTRYKSKLRGELKDTNQYSVTEYHLTSSLSEALMSNDGTSKLSQLTKSSAKPLAGTNDQQSVPNGAFFFYEISPIRVRVTEKSRSFAHLITQLVAIVGGVITVAGLIDRFVYAGMQYAKKRHSHR